MTIAQRLEAYTAAHSNFETKRNYISLSHANMEVGDLVNQYLNGFTDDHLTRLRCYKGYQMEADLKKRIVAVFDLQVNPNVEISVFDGLVKGHPDFTFDLDPGDCKAVPLDEHLPKDGRVSRKIFAQMQAYMHYMGRKKSVVIFESRESGLLRDVWLNYVPSVGKQIDEKMKAAVIEVTRFRDRVSA